ncbi:hypothetical protein L0222_07565 [bacterium]|nr:hypothetical protein [bacterium]
MHVPSVSQEIWQELYQQAIRFRELEPWKWMEEADVFGIQDPGTSQIGYGTIMGILGEVLAFCVYRGSGGLTFHQRLLDDAMTKDDFIAERNHLMVEFVAKKELEPEDKKIIAILGLRFQGTKQYPQFRSHLPGYCPWFVNESEARFLAFALLCAIDASLLKQKDPSFLFRSREAEYLTYIPKERGSFSKIWQKPAPIPVPEIQIPQPNVHEIRSRNLRKDSAWQAHWFFLPGAIQDKERPYFPKCLMIAHEKSGFIIAMEVVHPEEGSPADLEKKILQSMDETNLLPSEIQVLDQRVHQALAPLGELLGIRIVLRRELGAITEARLELGKSMRR